MKAIFIALMLAINTQPISTNAFDLSDLFKSKKKEKVIQKPKKKHTVKRVEPKSNPPSTPAPNSKNPSYVRINGILYYQVSDEWMAHYLVLEATWDYQIPEDDKIWYDNGKYYVPPVVYRHYEDMAKTTARSDSDR